MSSFISIRDPYLQKNKPTKDTPLLALMGNQHVGCTLWIFGRKLNFMQCNSTILKWVCELVWSSNSNSQEMNNSSAKRRSNHKDINVCQKWNRTSQILVLVQLDSFETYHGMFIDINWSSTGPFLVHYSTKQVTLAWFHNMIAAWHASGSLLKTQSNQCRNPQYKNKMLIRLSYLYNRNPYMCEGLIIGRRPRYTENFEFS